MSLIARFKENLRKVQVLRYNWKAPSDHQYRGLLEPVLQIWSYGYAEQTVKGWKEHKCNEGFTVSAGRTQVAKSLLDLERTLREKFCGHFYHELFIDVRTTRNYRTVIEYCGGLLVLLDHSQCSEPASLRRMTDGFSLLS